MHSDREPRVSGSVKVIEKNAFRGCSGLKTVKCADGLTHIGEGAFADCSSLETVQIPASVMNIEEGAFENAPCLIKGEKGSFAENYAEENDIAFSE